MIHVHVCTFIALALVLSLAILSLLLSWSPWGPAAVVTTPTTSWTTVSYKRYRYVHQLLYFNRHACNNQDSITRVTKEHAKCFSVWGLGKQCLAVSNQIHVAAEYNICKRVSERRQCGGAHMPEFILKEVKPSLVPRLSLLRAHFSYDL